MAKNAFVTGGTGFIGLNLVELLVGEGWRVAALHRSTSDLTYLDRFPIDFVEGSITDRDSLIRGIPEGTDVVFHVAGDTSFWSKGNAQQDAINIDGTRHMVEVAASKGVSTFIHTSSISAWGRVEGCVTEETQLRGRESWINYERSKHLGELEAFRGMDLGMKVVTLNPANVVGPFDTNTWGRLFFLLRDGALPAVAPGVVSVAHVHDVVQAHLNAVTEGANGARYILAGEHSSMGDFVGEFCQLLGVKPPSVAPPWILRAFAHLSVWIATITGKEPDVTPEIAAVTSQTKLSFSSERAIRELGYRVRSMDGAIKDNFDWLVNEGLLAKP